VLSSDSLTCRESQRRHAVKALAIGMSIACEVLNGWLNGTLAGVEADKHFLSHIQAMQLLMNHDQMLA